MTEATRSVRMLRRTVWLVGGAGIALCILIALLYLVTRPNAARIDEEQKAIFSSYLFQYPLVARPLPTVCGELQRRYDSSRPATLLVSGRTLLRLPSAAVIIDLPKEKLRARGVPLTTFNDFFVRNLTSGTINSIPEPSNVKLEFLPELKTTETQKYPVSVAFSKVGFNHDLSWAMFYAELSCGTQRGTEYVYLTRDWKHNQQWYVTGVDRLSGSSINLMGWTPGPGE